MSEHCAIERVTPCPDGRYGCEVHHVERCCKVCGGAWPCLTKQLELAKIRKAAWEEEAKTVRKERDEEIERRIAAEELAEQERMRVSRYRFTVERLLAYTWVVKIVPADHPSVGTMLAQCSICKATGPVVCRFNVEHVEFCPVKETLDLIEEIDRRQAQKT
jgi:hypothetical protein